MLKAGDQHFAPPTWTAVFEVVGVAMTTAVSAALVMDGRLDPLSRGAVVVGGGVATMVWGARLTGWHERSSLMLVGGSLVALAMGTSPVGGLAFLLPAALLLAAVTLGPRTGRGWVGRSVRVLVAAAGVLTPIAAIGIGAVFEPVLVPLLIWSVVTAEHWSTRLVLITLLGVNLAIGLAFLAWLVGFR